MNIPTRYCTGYITDIGLPPPYEPMDFAAWMEVYLGGRWHVFDPGTTLRGWGGSRSPMVATPRTCRSAIPSARTS